MKSRLEPEILRLHALGMTGAAIARQLGCTPPCVSQALKRHGLGRKPKPAPPIQRHVAAALDEAMIEPARVSHAPAALRRFSFQDLPSPDYVRSVAA